MNTYLIFASGFAAGIIAKDLYERYQLVRELRRWTTPKLEVTSDDNDLARTPPNVGGIGNPEYAGPNYVTQLENVHDLKNLPHFGTYNDEEDK